MEKAADSKKSTITEENSLDIMAMQNWNKIPAKNYFPYKIINLFLQILESLTSSPFACKGPFKNPLKFLTISPLGRWIWAFSPLPHLAACANQLFPCYVVDALVISLTALPALGFRINYESWWASQEAFANGFSAF